MKTSETVVVWLITQRRPAPGTVSGDLYPVGVILDRVEDHHVVAVILRQADQILLCHRAPGRRWYPNVWDFPGGHVQPGERPEDALRREVAEELGAELEDVDGDPVLHRVDPQAGLDLTVWVSTRWRGTVSNLQPEEHDAIGWFETEQLDDLSFADTSYLALLQRLLSG